MSALAQVRTLGDHVLCLTHNDLHFNSIMVKGKDSAKVSILSLSITLDTCHRSQVRWLSLLLSLHCRSICQKFSSFEIGLDELAIFSRFQLIDWEFASMGNPARDVGVVVAMLLAFHYFHMLQPVNNSQHRRTAYNLQECCVKFGMTFHYALLNFTFLQGNTNQSFN